MTPRRGAILGLASAALLAASAVAWAQAMHVVETKPADHATIDTRTEGFFVRFDRPVDHIRSTLLVKRGDRIVQTLHPRYNSAPEVLFARPQPLEPGDYTLEWSVNALDGKDVAQGQISFSVAARKTTAN
jgi:methionine-rich copper-binding protein CopC